MGATVLQLLTFALFSISWCSCQSSNQSIKLVNDVLRNYDKRIRPNLNQSLPTNVSLSFYILNIDEFNEVDGRFSISVVLLSMWDNDLITWDPTDYGGIDSHVFSVREVWYPELFLVFQVGKTDNFVKDWMTVRTFHDGSSGLSFISLFSSSCSVDITYYPFDTQVCVLTLGPVSYEENEVYLKPLLPYVDTSMLTPHGAWELLETSAFSEEGETVVLTFKLERKPLYFVVNIILPIMLMSVLSSLIFALPPQSGERVSYGITVLLAIAVFLTLVGDNLPKTSNPMSFLSYYLMFNLAVSTTMCIVAILNLRLYFYEGDDKIPMWARCLIRATCTGQRSPVSVKDTNVVEKRNRRIGDESQEIYKPGSETGSQQQRDKTSWVDVSKAVDKLCIVCFLLVTMLGNVSFIMVISTGKSVLL